MTNQTFEEAYRIIQDISQNVCAKFAVDCDHNNRFPVEAFSAIKECNLQALLIPKKYGGWGLNFYEYQQCLSRISQGCPATAAAFNMHNIIMGSISNYSLDMPVSKRQHTLEKMLSKIFGMVVEEQKIFAAATTETGIGARFSKVKTNYQRYNDTYLLNGQKSFVTMANYADYYLVLASKKLDDDNVDDKYHLTYFVVPRNAAGVSVIENWDTLGMRGTASHIVKLENVRLSKDAIFMGTEGFALVKVINEPHWITGGYLGVYLGIIEAIFNFTCEYIANRSDYSNKTGLAFEPLIQARLGELYIYTNNARLNVYESAKKVIIAPKETPTHQAIYAAKYYLSESMPKIAALALRTCGGACISRKYPLERLLRDSMCGALMPAVSDMCQIFLGKTF